VSRGPAGSDDDLAARLEALRGALAAARAGLARPAGGEPAAPSRRKRRWAGAAVVGVVAAAGAAAGELAAGGHRTSVKAPGSSPTRPAAAPTSVAAPPASSPATTILPAAEPPATVPPAPAAPSGTVPPAPVPAPATPAPPATVVVQPGQSFWSIAESVLDQRLGRAPDAAELAGFWARLVAANYGRLVVAGDPNLIYPGQVLVLPGG